MVGDSVRRGRVKARSVQVLRLAVRTGGLSCSDGLDQLSYNVAVLSRRVRADAARLPKS